VHPKRRLVVLLILIGAATVMANIGGWFGPAILVDHPLLEMFLNPANRYLALASNRVDVTAFYGVGFFRLALTDPVFYLFGLSYGDAALQWLRERSAGSARLLQTVERWFAKAGWVIVFIAPNAIVCLLAGATKMRVLPFVVLDVTGTIARLVLIRALADVFTGPLAAATRFIDRYQWWLLAITIGLGVWQAARRPESAPREPPAEEPEPPISPRSSP
jgi:membrane protein DedA with SNARE-associated domain